MHRAEIKPLTSLRFFAAGGIVVHHLASLGLPHVSIPLAHAVPFFFALSGFILAYNYEDTPDFRPSRFLLGRIGRLWPVHATCILIGFLALPSFWSEATQDGGWLVLLANVLLIHDWLPDYRFAFSFNAVSWSISAEMFFYLIFPFLIRSRERMLLGLGLLILLNLLLLSMSSGLKLDHTGPVFERSAYYAWAHLHPLASVPGFILGMLTASLFRSARELRVGPATATICEVLAIGLCTWWLTAGFGMMRPRGMSDVSNVYYSFNSALLVAPIIIFVFAWERGLLSRALSWEPLVFLGKISFSTYMVHQLVFRFAGQQQWTLSLGKWPTIILAVAIAYLASWLLWRFVETPGRKLVMSIGNAKQRGRRWPEMPIVPRNGAEP